MKGLIPPLLLSRFLQRQPLAIHCLRQCVVEEARKYTPSTHVRFSLRSDGISSDHRGRGSDGSDPQGEGDASDGERELVVNSAEFANNALASFVYVNNSCKQYEDPVGISEFIGYNTAPRTRRRQRRRHRCCRKGTAAEQEERGGGGGGEGGEGESKEWFFSSGSCEECGMHDEGAWLGGGEANSTGGGRRRYMNYVTQ